MATIGINLSSGTLQQEELVVGIDLGTTNSLVARIHPSTKKAQVIKDVDQSELVPSIIHFGPAGIVVGEAAKPFLETDPTNTIFSIKRLMGKSYQDIQKDKDLLGYEIIDNNTDALVKIRVGDNFYTPIELSSLILKELKQRAEHACKTEVKKAVITVPAYFNDTQRQATRDAGKLAGLDVLRIINEPTAASLAYGIGLNPEEEKTIVVYDLGGGTFDVTILKIENGIFEVLATSGDTYLGGDDFDKIIIEMILKASSSSLPNDKGAIQGLRLLAESIKRTLSDKDEAEFVYNNQSVTITRKAFEEAATSLIEKTIECCSSAMKDAQLTSRDIDEVLLVGGSTRMPIVQSALAAYFGKTPNTSVHPDEAVALGAALQADVLSGNNKDLLLLDVTPLSLGVETMGGLMDVIIPRNSKIPFGAGREYTTYKDGQTKMKISVFQGERDLVEDNRKLAEFELNNIPPMPAGLAKVSIVFKLDSDGILQIEAKEIRSGVAATITVQPQYGLTDDEVEAMLLASITHAKSDITIRALREAKTEGEQLIFATRNFLAKHQSFIQPDEVAQTNLAIQELEAAISSDHKDNIQKAIESLNAISKPYAERVMDTAISAALKGKSL